MKKIDQELSFLFSRLTWPSGMVRERTCIAIADLLIDSRWSEIVQKQLIRWITTQRLESIAAIGLLILLRAKIQNSNFVPPSVEELSSVVHRPSVLSWVLMNELAPLNAPSSSWASLNSGSVPGDFKPEPFFTKYACNFLPSIYTDTAKDIEANKHVPFVKQWSFEWHKILEDIGKKPSTSPLDFLGRKDSEHYVALDFELSEVYRSAYLRTLAWAVMVGALSENDAKFWAIRTCPIDLGLWRLSPTSQPPTWWPKADEPEGKIDTVPAQIWKQVEVLWEKQRVEKNDWILAEAIGRVHEGNNTIYDLEIFGLFQVCQGPSSANLEYLTDWYRWENNVSYTPCSLRFEGVIKTAPPNSLARNFDDWSIVPVTCRVSPCTTLRWQFWRMHRDIWFPAPFLGFNSLAFKCLDDTLIIQDGDDIVGKWNDWTFALKEKMTANLSPSSGQHLLVQRKRIERFTEETNSVFCWICRLTGYHREYDHQPYKHFTDYRQHGTTSIVIFR